MRIKIPKDHFGDFMKKLHVIEIKVTTHTEIKINHSIEISPRLQNVNILVIKYLYNLRP